MFFSNKVKNFPIKERPFLCNLSLVQKKYFDNLSSRAESIFLFSRKIACIHSVQSLKLPFLAEQQEKFYLFYYATLWDIEEDLRMRYLLRMVLAFKKQRLSTVLGTSKPNFIFDFFAVERYASLMLSFVETQFLLDVDSLNSRFVLFFFFLTKINNFLLRTELPFDLVKKKKNIFRNIFFLFIFSIHRLKFFSKMASYNFNISDNYLFSKENYKNFKVRFPRQLFLLFYSPFKVSYNHGLSLILYKQRRLFLRRLKVIQTYVVSKKYTQSVVGNSTGVLKKEHLVLGALKFNGFIKISSNLFFRKLKHFQKIIKPYRFAQIESLDKMKNLKWKRKTFLKYFHKRNDSNFVLSVNDFRFKLKESFLISSFNKKFNFFSNFIFLRKFIKLLNAISSALSNVRYFYFSYSRTGFKILNFVEDLKKVISTHLRRARNFKCSFIALRKLHYFSFYFFRLFGSLGFTMQELKVFFDGNNFPARSNPLLFFSFLNSTHFFSENVLFVDKFKIFLRGSNLLINSGRRQSSIGVSFIKKFSNFFKDAIEASSLCNSKSSIYFIKKTKNLIKKQFLNFVGFPLGFSPKVADFLGITRFLSMNIFPEFYYSKNFSFVLNVIGENSFYVQFISYLVRYFLIMFRNFNFIVHFLDYMNLFKFFLLHKFYPYLLLRLNIQNCSSFFFSEKLLAEIDDLFYDYLKLKNFHILYVMLRKNKRLRPLFEFFLRRAPLKLSDYAKINLVQQAIAESESNKLLEYDSKEFALNFVKRMKSAFFVKVRDPSTLRLKRLNFKKRLLRRLARSLRRKVHKIHRINFLFRKKQKNVFSRFLDYKRKKYKKLRDLIRKKKLYRFHKVYKKKFKNSNKAKLKEKFFKLKTVCNTLYPIRKKIKSLYSSKYIKYKSIPFLPFCLFVSKLERLPPIKKLYEKVLFFKIVLFSVRGISVTIKKYLNSTIKELKNGFLYFFWHAKKIHMKFVLRKYSFKFLKFCKRLRLAKRKFLKKYLSLFFTFYFQTYFMKIRRLHRKKRARLSTAMMFRKHYYVHSIEKLNKISVRQHANNKFVSNLLFWFFDLMVLFIKRIRFVIGSLLQIFRKIEFNKLSEIFLVFKQFCKNITIKLRNYFMIFLNLLNRVFLKFKKNNFGVKLFFFVIYFFLLKKKIGSASLFRFNIINNLSSNVELRIAENFALKKLFLLDSYEKILDLKFKNVVKFLNVHERFKRFFFLSRTFSFQLLRKASVLESFFLLKFNYLKKKNKMSFFFKSVSKPLSKGSFFHKNFIKFLKYKQKRRLRKFGKFKKKKLNFREKWREWRRFFVQAYFFNRFLKEKSVRYSWNSYGENIIKTLHSFEFQSTFFFRLKFKRFFIFGLNDPVAPISRAVYRISFLNSSHIFKLLIDDRLIFSLFNIEKFSELLYNFKLKNNSSVLNLTNQISEDLLSPFKKSWTQSFLKNLSTITTEFSNIFQFFYFWLVSIKNFCLNLNFGFLAKVLDNQFSEYMTLVSFYRRIGSLVIFPELLGVVLEIFIFYGLFAALKTTYINLFFGVSKFLLSSTKMGLKSYFDNRTIFVTKSSYATFILLPQKKDVSFFKKIKSFVPCYFAVSKFESSRVSFFSLYSKKFKCHGKSLFFNLSTLNSYFSKLFLKVLYPDLLLSISWSYFMFCVLLKVKFFFKIPAHLLMYNLVILKDFFDRSRCILPEIEPNRSLKIVETKKNVANQLGFFTFLYSSFFQKQIFSKKFRLLVRLKFRMLKFFLKKKFSYKQKLNKFHKMRKKRTYVFYKRRFLRKVNISSKRQAKYEYAKISHVVTRMRKKLGILFYEKAQGTLGFPRLFNYVNSVPLNGKNIEVCKSKIYCILPFYLKFKKYIQRRGINYILFLKFYLLFLKRFFSKFRHGKKLRHFSRKNIVYLKKRRFSKKLQTKNVRILKRFPFLQAFGKVNWNRNLCFFKRSLYKYSNPPKMTFVLRKYSNKKRIFFGHILARKFRLKRYLQKSKFLRVTQLFSLTSGDARQFKEFPFYEKVRIPNYFWFSKSLKFLFRYYINRVIFQYVLFLSDCFKKIKVLIGSSSHNSSLLNFFSNISVLVDFMKRPPKSFLLNCLIWLTEQKKHLIVKVLANSGYSSSGLKNVILRKLDNDFKNESQKIFNNYRNFLLLELGSKFFFRIRNRILGNWPFSNSYVRKFPNLNSFFRNEKRVGVFHVFYGNAAFKKFFLNSMFISKFFFDFYKRYMCVKHNILQNVKLRRFINLYIIVKNSIQFLINSFFFIIKNKQNAIILRIRLFFLYLMSFVIYFDLFGTKSDFCRRFLRIGLFSLLGFAVNFYKICINFCVKFKEYFSEKIFLTLGSSILLGGNYISFYVFSVLRWCFKGFYELGLLSFVLSVVRHQKLFRSFNILMIPKSYYSALHIKNFFNYLVQFSFCYLYFRKYVFSMNFYQESEVYFKELFFFKLKNCNFFNTIFLSSFVILYGLKKETENSKFIWFILDFLFILLKDNYLSLKSLFGISGLSNFKNKYFCGKNVWFLDNKNLLSRKRFKKRIVKRNKLFVSNFINFIKFRMRFSKYYKLLSKRVFCGNWKLFFGSEKFLFNKLINARLVKAKYLKSSGKSQKFSFQLGAFKRSKKIYQLSVLSKFHPIIRKKIFLDCFFSPRFFNFLTVQPKDLFLVNKSYNWVYSKFSLLSRVTRFLHFLVRLLFSYKKIIFEKALRFFNYLVKLYFVSRRFVKRILRKVANYILHLRRRKIITRSSSFLSVMPRNLLLLNTFKFSFFYNLISRQFLRFFFLRTQFFSDYLKYRMRFINRYLWFRVVAVKNFLKKPKIFIIVSKTRNNFFLTAIDLFGRVLYKSSPGMVGYTGTDRVSKYAWHDTAVDLFGGLIEFSRYSVKRKLRRRQGFFYLYKRRITSTYLASLENMFAKFSSLKTKFLKRDFFKGRSKALLRFHSKSRYMKRYQKDLIYRDSKKKRRKKYLKSLKTNFRRFFIISKGASFFNLRMILKGMRQYRKLKIFKFFTGSVTFPMKSFTLCRIKKVRRM